MADKSKNPGLQALLLGAGGIYGSFLYYGLLQESVTHYKAADGSQLERTWFLQTAEALANVLVGLIGMMLVQGGPSKGIPYVSFALTGLSQVTAKALTTQALIAGLSFPVATLAKSAKMVPVMLGSIIISGTIYPIRKYLQVALIVGGTVMVNMSKKKASGESDTWGLVFIMGSLACDGLTGGVQDRMKASYKKTHSKSLQPYDMMFFTNLFMCLVALVVSLATNQFFGGIQYVTENPECAKMLFYFSMCSAAGQFFIFYTIANLGPLTCSTVTTTRKIFTVLLSIFVHGHPINEFGWAGIGTASLGIIGELAEKMGGSSKKDSTKKEP